MASELLLECRARRLSPPLFRRGFGRCLFVPKPSNGAGYQG
jgi:hypothetical protein